MENLNDIEKENHKSKDELSEVERTLIILSKMQKKKSVVRGARLLANGEIKISKRISKNIRTGNSPTLFRYNFSEKYIEETNKNALFKLSSSSCVGENKLLPTNENSFAVAADLFGVFKNTKIKRLYISYFNCKHNINILKNRKSKLTKCKNQIEKSYLEMTKYSEYRENVFNKVELYLYDIYEKLYIFLAGKEEEYIKGAIEKLEKLEKYFNEEGYDLNNYNI